MSVNITVNGKFAKQCRGHHLLDDPQEVRKAEEKERRKLRLLQVREESKKLAKKIRDEVNEEKRRELQKLQATKERELECWRQHALQRKGEEYRDAIFQIGTAHEAAKKENEKNNAKPKPQTYKDFKKQMAAKKCQPVKVQFNSQVFCPCQQTLHEANKQFKCTCVQTDEHNTKSKLEAQKRKRNFSFSSSESESEDEVFKEQATLAQTSFTLSSTCDSTSSSFNNNKVSQTSLLVPTKNKCLIKTPAVLLDVEVGTDDSVTISAPAELKDKHAEYNRQFSSVIRVSPRKESKQKENTTVDPSIQQSPTTTKEQNKNKSCLEKSQNKQLINALVPKEKRFTIISDLVKKQEETELIPVASSHVASCPPNFQTTSVTVTSILSPRKQAKEISVRPTAARSLSQSPRKISATSKSPKTSSIPHLTSLPKVSKKNTAVVSGSSNSGRVQFYDYNSKLTKEKSQTATTVSVERQRDENQPSAMEQAELEKQRERERQLEALKKCQIMEERGQKALEREQIRRDCHELTEKLELLTREYANQLPSNNNQLHIFADKQLRKESKMNSAVEKLLQRPVIITCSEHNKQNKDEVNHKSSKNTVNLANTLNVASLNNKPLPADDVSSESCCSILLGYVDDQSKLIKEDLENNDTTQNQAKQKRLKNLLKRLDQLRNSLLQELRSEGESNAEKSIKKKSKFSSNEENLRQVIDSISEMRKEHEEILIKEKAYDPKQLSEREKELQSKEELLDKKVRAFYELQKENKSQKTSVKKDLNQSTKKEEKERDDSSLSSDKTNELKINSNREENVICDKKETPLEIIITVRGDTKCVKIPQKSKRKIFHKRSPGKLSTLIKRSPQHLLSMAKKHSPKRKPQVTKVLNAQTMLRRQNSYDSNSTSYMSLPPELSTKIDNLAQCLTKESVDQLKKPTKESKTVNKITSTQNEQQERETSLESLNKTPKLYPKPHVNPLIAQYVHRLLGMSRGAIHKLNVSSSDVETPGSSIINTTSNVSNADTIISDERLINLQNFIEENKSFIKDLEESIRLQNNVSLENSMRMFDDIWRKRLKAENLDATKIKKVEENRKEMRSDKFVKDKKTEQKSNVKTKKKIVSKTNQVQQMVKTPPRTSKHIARPTISTDNLLKDLSKSLSSHDSTDDKESTTSLKTCKRPVKTFDKAIDAKLSIDSSKSEHDSQIARYAKLTENCTNRIAELTQLINRVREEKQRLLEVTLSSVSENGRQSTEYLEIPEGKSTGRNEQDDLTRVSSSSEETTRSKQSRLNSDALHEMTKLSLADKSKQIANSRDSGIAESRPMTALENRIDQEPLSQTSSESIMPQAIRKMKPPPTLKRFSPQLPEDDLAHELSTILEVDTPATSRINTAAGQSAEEKESVFHTALQQPIKFPTFEQYIKQLDLDLTHLDPEQSIQLQQEYTTFLEYLKHNHLRDLHLDETLEESLDKLHISNIPPRNFPALREYLKRNTSKSVQTDEHQLLDTESLENITDGQTRTDNDTTSLDFEKELIERQILKNPFRVIKSQKQQIFSSTAHRDAAFYKEILAVESGVDKLSTTDNTSDLLDSESKRILRQLPGKLVKKSKNTKILSSTTSSTNISALANSALRAASLDVSSKGSGRAFNVRDFLTRELQKLANNSSSMTNSSSDESLASNFLHSLIGSFTPLTAGAGSKSGGQILDRQKTSTPVTLQSSQIHSTSSSHSNASSQLFSGESRLSSVHYQEHVVPILTSEDANADEESV